MATSTVTKTGRQERSIIWRLLGQITEVPKWNKASRESLHRITKSLSYTQAAQLLHLLEIKPSLDPMNIFKANYSTELKQAPLVGEPFNANNVLYSEVRQYIEDKEMYNQDGEASFASIEDVATELEGRKMWIYVTYTTEDVSFASIEDSMFDRHQRVIHITHKMDREQIYEAIVGEVNLTYVTWLRYEATLVEPIPFQELPVRNGEINCCISALQMYIDETQDGMQQFASTTSIAMYRDILTEHPCLINFAALAMDLQLTFVFRICDREVFRCGSGPDVQFELNGAHVMAVSNLGNRKFEERYEIVDDIQLCYENELPTNLITGCIRNDDGCILSFTSTDFINDTKTLYKDATTAELVESICLQLKMEHKKHYTNSLQVEYDEFMQRNGFDSHPISTEALEDSMINPYFYNTAKSAPGNSYDRNQSYASWDTIPQYEGFPARLNQFTNVVSVKTAIASMGIVRLDNASKVDCVYLNSLLLRRTIGHYIPTPFLRYIVSRGAVCEVSNLYWSVETVYPTWNEYTCKSQKRNIIGKSFTSKQQVYTINDAAWKDSLLKSIQGFDTISLSNEIRFTATRKQCKPSQLRSFALAYHQIAMCETVQFCNSNGYHVTHVGVDNIIGTGCFPKSLLSKLPGGFKCEGYKTPRVMHLKTRPVPTIETPDETPFATHTLIYGAAGTSKSYSICDLLSKYKPTTFRYLTPSMQLAASVHEKFGIDAMHFQKWTHSATLEDFLGIPSENDTEAIKKRKLRQIDAMKAMRLPRVIVLDEFAMIPLEYTRALHSFFTSQGSICIYIGDRSQLAPVGGDSPFDYIASVCKTKIHKTTDYRSKEMNLSEFKTKLKDMPQMESIMAYMNNSTIHWLDEVVPIWKPNDVICSSTLETRQFVNDYMYAAVKGLVTEVPCRWKSGKLKNQLIMQPYEFDSSKYELSICWTITSLQGSTMSGGRNVFLCIDRLDKQWIQNATYMVASRAEYANQLHSILFRNTCRPREETLGHIRNSTVLAEKDVYIDKDNDEMHVAYRYADICGLPIVIRDAIAGKFIGFHNQKSASMWVTKQLRSGPQSFHECVSTSKPHRIYFDIDSKVAVDVAYIKKCIQNVFELCHGIELLENDILHWSCIREGKYGHHFAIKYYMVAGKEVYKMNKLLQQMMQQGDCVDVLGKSLQMLRMSGSIKVGDTSGTCYKAVGSQHWSDIWLQGHVDDIWLPSESGEMVQNWNICDADVAEIVRKIESDGCHKLSSIHNGIISFRRLKPSHCVSCDRMHESDNTCYILLGKDGNHRVKCRGQKRS